MNTNQFFSFSRFYKLLKSDLLINYKQYLYAILAALILGFVFIYLNMPKEYYSDQVYWNFNGVNYVTIFISLLFGLGIFVGMAFPAFSSKVKTSNYLLIPTSTFEKFVSQFFIRIVCGLIIFLVVFWIDAHLARIVSIRQLIDIKTNLHYSDAEKFIESFNFHMLLADHKEFPDGLTIYRNTVQSWGLILIILALGFYLFSVRLFFQKLGLMKTVISFVVVVFIFAMLLGGFSYLFYPEIKGFQILPRGYNLSNVVINIEFWTFVIAGLSTIILIILTLGFYLFSVRLFFQKLGLMKTVISFVVVVLIFAMLLGGFSYLFYPEIKGFQTGPPFYNLSIDVSNNEFWTFVIAGLSTIILLPLGYFKLKEKQV